MSDENITSALGVKIATSVWGFAGGVVSLALIKDLTGLQAAIAVVVGLVTAAALTPVVAGWLGTEHPGVENGTAFLIGLCAMSVLPVVRNAIPEQLRKKISLLLGLREES